MSARTVHAPRGTELSCRGWPQEAALRMLMNNLDPDVAERPDELVVYGGTGRAARSWEAFDAILATLRELAGDETLLVQSGKPVGVFRTHEWAPRVLIANSNLVAGVGNLGRVPAPRGARADDVRADDGRLLDLYREPGHRAGDLRVLRGDRAAALRRLARRNGHAHRRAGRDGRRAAACGDDERGRCAVRGGRPRPDPPPARDALPRRGGGRPGRRRRALPARQARAARAERRALRERRRRSARAAPPGLRGGRGDRPDERSRPARRLHPRRPDARRGGGAARDAIRTSTSTGRGCRPRPTASRWSASWTRAPRSSTTGTACAPRPSSAASSAPSTTRASSRPTSARSSARAGGRSAGSRCPATPRTSRPPTARSSTSSRATRASPAGSAWPASGSRSRGCPRGSAGSATASGAGWGSASTRW